MKFLINPPENYYLVSISVITGYSQKRTPIIEYFNIELMGSNPINAAIKAKAYCLLVGNVWDITISPLYWNDDKSLSLNPIFFNNL